MPCAPRRAGATGGRAQIDTGTIVGRVQDSTGAVLPGVTVTAAREGTGVVTTSVTNDSGEFVFPGLRIGVYAVTRRADRLQQGQLRSGRGSTCRTACGSTSSWASAS